MHARSFVTPLLVLAAFNAGAQTPPSLPSSALKAWETHARQYCGSIGERYVGARFKPMPASDIDGSGMPAGTGRYLAVDFNDDGKPDFVIATPNGGCAGLNEGRDGPQLTVEFVVSTASGHVRDSQSSTDGYDSTLVMPSISPAWVQRRGNAQVLRYPTGSAGAGRCGPLPAEVVWGWNGRHVEVLERYNARNQPVDAEGCAARPARATAAAQGRPGTTAARIPLAVGYYAYVEGTFSTCAKPVGDMLYFDGKRFWTPSDFTDPRHEFTSEALKWEMSAADRFRITSRSRDEDGQWDPHLYVTEYVITGPQSFTFVGTVGGRMNARENYQLCPNIPARSRFFKAAR